MNRVNSDGIGWNQSFSGQARSASTSPRFLRRLGANETIFPSVDPFDLEVWPGSMPSCRRARRAAQSAPPRRPNSLSKQDTILRSTPSAQRPVPCVALLVGSPWRMTPLHSSRDASHLTALFVGCRYAICALLTPCQAGARRELAARPSAGPPAPAASDRVRPVVNGGRRAGDAGRRRGRSRTRRDPAAARGLGPRSRCAGAARVARHRPRHRRVARPAARAGGDS